MSFMVCMVFSSVPETYSKLHTIVKRRNLKSCHLNRRQVMNTKKKIHTRFSKVRVFIDYSVGRNNRGRKYIFVTLCLSIC